MSDLQEKAARLYAIANEIATCKKCPLCNSRTRTVPGAGPANAEIMFIGEAPGFHEDQQGLPFVGRSGQYLNQLLASVGLSRKDVFIGNVVKCRPPDNRDPEQAELDACKDYLDRQIAVINPRVIITLGRFSMARYFPGARITQAHGHPRQVDGRLCFPMYHPAAVLRNPNLGPEMQADMKKVMQAIQEMKAGGQPPEQQGSEEPPEPPVQLSLF